MLLRSRRRQISIALPVARAAARLHVANHLCPNRALVVTVDNDCLTRRLYCPCCRSGVWVPTQPAPPAPRANADDTPSPAYGIRLAVASSTRVAEAQVVQS